MLVALTNRKGELVGSTVIDSADVPLVLQFKAWRLTSQGYARANQGTSYYLMHRLILGLPAGDTRECDHINGDKLDNRRANLRVATHAENMQNRRPHRHSRSGLRGVKWCGDINKWQAVVSVGKKRHCLGVYEDPAEAAAVAMAFRRENVPFAVEGRGL